MYSQKEKYQIYQSNIESIPVNFKSKTGIIQYFTQILSQCMRPRKIQSMERKNITIITADGMLIYIKISPKIYG